MSSVDRTGCAVRLPLVLEPQPGGGYAVTSPLVPELHTCGDTLDEVLLNVQDAWQAVLEVYDEMGWELPEDLFVDPAAGPFTIETVFAA